MADILSAKQLQEERAPLATLINEMSDVLQAENRDFTAEEKVKWEKVNGEYDRLSNLINVRVRAEKLLKEQLDPVDEVPAQQHNPTNRIPQPGRQDYDGRKVMEDIENRNQPTEADHVLALQGWMRAQCRKPLKAEHEQACRRTGVQPYADEYNASLHQGSFRQYRNALSSQTGASGNFTIPEGFVPNLERALLQYNGVRGVADVMRTEGGNDLPWPTINATSNKGRILGENTTDSTTLEPTFGRLLLRAYKYTSDFIKVPVELLEDSAFQLAGMLGDLGGEAIGRIQADHFTTGTGAGQPLGLVTACANLSATQSAASASAISYDDILALEHSVDPAYRNSGNCVFMCHDSILLAIRKLKDGQGRPLWSAGVTAGAPDTLSGYQLINNQSMDSTISSGKYSLLFGDVTKYKVRDAGGVRMIRLNERFADTDQVAFIAFLRSDGNLLYSGVAPVKVLSH